MSGFPKKRDIKALEGVSFDNVPLADLPEIIQEAEAELARAGEFERCFPASVGRYRLNPVKTHKLESVWFNP